MRRHLFAMAVIVLAAAAVFAPTMARHEIFTIRDHVDYFQPLRYFTAEHLRAFHLPLWNPYNASGEPWLANPQTGVFYPPTWLFVVLPFTTAYMLYLFVHVAILGLGAYALFVRNATRGAALVGALAVMLSGPALSLMDVNNNLATFAWVPLAIWCGLARRAVLGGVVLALAFLGGEPFFAGLAAILFALAAALEDRRSRLSGQAGLPVLQAAVIAFGLCAIQLIPFLELLRGSDRSAGIDPNVIFRDSMRPAEWLRIAIPPHGIESDLSQHFIPIIYVGALTVALALLGLTRPRRAWPWLVLFAVSAIVAAGNYLPTGAWLAHSPVTLFRYPARMIPFAALAVAALAVIGLDRLPKRRVWIDVAVIAILIVDLDAHTAPLRHSVPFFTNRVPYDASVGRDLKIARLGGMTRNRIAFLGGYQNLYARRFDANIAAPVASHAYAKALDDALGNGRVDRLDSMSVGWLISERPVSNTHYEFTTRVDNMNLYRSRGALPMARLVDEGGAMIAPVRTLLLDTSQARMSVDAPRAGTLLLTQQNAPGWKVFVDGVESKPLVIDGIFRGVAITAGKHVILWTFRPFSLLLGAAVSIVTLAALTLWLTTVKRRSARKKFSVSH
jgi:hypothetical protein